MKKPVWSIQATIEALNERSRGTMLEHLGILFTEIGDDFISARMPVDQRTKQPAGILHGGASVVLAESVGSTAGNLAVDFKSHYCVGLDINANHIRSCTDGFVDGIARPLHLGKATQVWEIRVTQEEQLVCISRLTMAVLERAAK